MINMDCSLQSIVFISHLIFIGYAADAIGSFPSGCQLGGSLSQGGERKDQAADVVGVGCGRG